ncbi:ABC transporter permease [Acidobacteriota bacterium]
MHASLKKLYNHRVLVETLVIRELKARYRGSILGYFWSFLNPVLLLLVYSFVFTYIWQPARGGAPSPYGLFLFCGILPWTWLASSLLESANSLVSGGSLIKKVLFPAEVLPLVNVLSNMIHFLSGMVICFVFLVIYHKLTVYALLLPLMVLIQALFLTGLAFFFAVLSVHLRDLKDLLGNLLLLWFFTTPIIYTADFLPEQYRWLLYLNPLTHIMMGYQDILFFGTMFHWKRIIVTALFSLLVFIIGYAVFDRLRDTIAEEV